MAPVTKEKVNGIYHFFATTMKDGFQYSGEYFEKFFLRVEWKLEATPISVFLNYITIFLLQIFYEMDKHSYEKGQHFYQT